MEIGKYNELKFVKKSGAGLYFSDGKGEALLPYMEVPEGLQENDSLNLFVFLDGEDKPRATIQKPLACVDEFVALTVVSENERGAYMDWGLSKDLFVPLREQKTQMEIGEQYLVYISLDRVNGRIIGSTKLTNFIELSDFDVKQGDEVELIIADRTDLGYNAIVNKKYMGLLYHNEVFEHLYPGDVKKGYIKQIREDDKIDLSLQAIGYKQVLDFKTTLLNQLEKNNGVLALGDKSSPDEILNELKVSKKIFKKTIGALYKERLIDIFEKEIRLVNSDHLLGD
ncbi:S1-like domain-containing RNA-binding protein [Solitalea sp. MAHUQ-68]|uniref:S1-like domain-containing RNA-binding protein n=1 Tax=Solitalea agri TaxID=2953739 RepID=A0A9X2F416_9SPHI|nr:S1-like domain-containing RNA-binding protein [Solitalea agri]MCO4294362.1 S1-like domain-containing RNA-binding protein [Solitalea agri]